MLQSNSQWTPKARQIIPALVLLGLFVSSGCQPSHEELFRSAVAAVKAGERTAIDVRDAPLTDTAAVRELKGAVELEQLTLDKSPITDADLAAIGPLPKLHSLSLTRSRITNEGLVTIAKNFPGLLYLRLDETTISDAGLEPLQQLTQLQELSLYRTAVTSRGCPTLCELPALRRLSLDQTMVTDSGLDKLQAMKQLQRISIWQCQVSDQAVQRLKTALPDTEVNR